MGDATGGTAFGPGSREESETEPEGQMAYDLTALNVLLVDDNPHMRHLLRQILNAYGIKKVYEADDGAMGYEYFKQTKADVIVVDWMMERVNGIDFTRMVRTAEDSPNRFVPIIMLTGYSEKAHVVEARDCGVTEFIVKPVSAQNLYDRIATIIERPRPFVQVGSYFGPDRRRKVSAFTGADRRKNPKTANLTAPTKNEKANGASTTKQRTDPQTRRAMRDVRDRVGWLLHEHS